MLKPPDVLTGLPKWLVERKLAGSARCFKDAGDTALRAIAPDDHLAALVFGAEGAGDPGEGGGRDRERYQSGDQVPEDDLADPEQRCVHRDDARDPVGPLESPARDGLAAETEAGGDSG